MHAAEGATIQCVTHHIDESVYPGDRVAVLWPGPASKIVADLPVGLPAGRGQIGARGLPAFVERGAQAVRAARAAWKAEGRRRARLVKSARRTAPGPGCLTP